MVGGILGMEKTVSWMIVRNPLNRIVSAYRCGESKQDFTTDRNLYLLERNYGAFIVVNALAPFYIFILQLGRCMCAVILYVYTRQPSLVHHT